jgi:hypothetical protein
MTIRRTSPRLDILFIGVLDYLIPAKRSLDHLKADPLDDHPRHS